MMNEGWYNLQCPWNAMEYQSRKHEFAAKKRLNGSRILGGSYTPNAKGSRSCKGTVSQPYDSSWSLQPLGSQIFAMTQERQSGTGKTWQNCGAQNRCWSHTSSQWSASNDQPLECPWMTIQLWSRIPPRYRNSRIPRILVLDFSCILKSSTSLAPFQKAYVQYSIGIVMW